MTELYHELSSKSQDLFCTSLWEQVAPTTKVVVVADMRHRFELAFFTEKMKAQVMTVRIEANADSRTRRGWLPAGIYACCALSAVCCAC